MTREEIEKNLLRETNLKETVKFLLSELDKMEEKIKRLEIENRLRKSMVDRWVPCPDHRDKVQSEDGCYVCKLEQTEVRVKKLESDLKLNASMLAKQCDLAREAETRVHTLEEGIEYFIHYATGPDSTIKDIPDDIWIPFKKLLEVEG